MREIGVEELRHLARGAAILGTGGGGDPYIGRLVAEQAMLEYGPVLAAELHEVPDDALVAGIGMNGATIGMGCTALLSSFPMSGKQARDTTIPGTLTLASRLGRLVEEARRGRVDP